MSKNNYRLLNILICIIAATAEPVLAIGFAIGKQYADEAIKGDKPRKWGIFDILWDWVGIATGSMIHYTIFNCH